MKKKKAFSQYTNLTSYSQAARTGHDYSLCNKLQATNSFYNPGHDLKCTDCQLIDDDDDDCC